MHLKLLLFCCLAAVITGCATTNSKPDPLVGLWDYELHFIPQGEPLGIMTILKTEDGYAINLKSRTETGTGNDLIDVTVEGNILTGGHFFGQGYKIDVTGSFEENKFEGLIDAEGNTFRMTAVKQE